MPNFVLHYKILLFSPFNPGTDASGRGGKERIEDWLGVRGGQQEAGIYHVAVLIALMRHSVPASKSIAANRLIDHSKPMRSRIVAAATTKLSFTVPARALCFESSVKSALLLLWFLIPYTVVGEKLWVKEQGLCVPWNSLFQNLKIIRWVCPN